jgi:hypothetical protein
LRLEQCKPEPDDKELMQQVEKLKHLEAEAMKKALLEQATAIKAGLDDELPVAEALKKALLQNAEKLHKTHVQGELDEAEAQLQQSLIEEQSSLAKKLLQRGNDERIEKLAAMVNELAGQVERLQEELNALRGDGVDQNVGQEGKPQN